MGELIHGDDHLTVHVGDCRAVMAAMELESVQCVITSPPYWGLRDYGIPSSVWGGEPEHEHEWGAEERGKRSDMLPSSSSSSSSRNGSDERQGVGPPTGGQFCPCGAWLGALGLEPTPELFVEHVVEVFRAVRRVLRKDGTVWLNLGDSYATGAGRVGTEPGGGAQGGAWKGAGHRGSRGGSAKQPHTGNAVGPMTQPNRMPIRGLKHKDRVMIPARVALALQADGWWLRDEIVWSKPNPMPSSVRDRTTPAHEMVYLLTKAARYHYDAAAIAEDAASGPSDRRKMLEARERIGGLVKASDDPFMAASGLTNIGRRRSVGGFARSRNRGGRADGFTTMPGGEAMRGVTYPELTRNKRSVWSIPTQPYPEAHFATFPEALVEPMIRAGCPEGGTVLDPFGGSGTVALVAERLGRKAILIDLSEEYVEQALRRIAGGRAKGTGASADLPIPFADDGLWAEVLADA